MLGWAALAGQLVGAGINYFGGQSQAADAETMYERGRQDLLQYSRPTQALLDSVAEGKSMAAEAGRTGREQLDSSVSSLLDALQSGDQSAIASFQSAIPNIAQTSQGLEMTTAQNISTANQPLVDAEQKVRDTYSGLAQMDIQQGAAGYQAGTQRQMDAIGSAVNMPMDLAALQVSNPSGYSALFGKDGVKIDKGDRGALINEDVIKELIGGGLVYTGTGAEVTSFRDIMKKQEAAKKSGEEEEEEVEEEVKEEKEEEVVDKEGQERMNKRIERERRKGKGVTGRDGIKIEDYRRGGATDKPMSEELKEDIELLQLQLEKEKVQKEINSYAAGGKEDYIGGGNTLSQLLRPGQSFKTGGKEDHDVQEYDISDAETGQVVAKTTGQEEHMVNEDGSLTVINSEQNESIHDAFKDVDVEMVLKALERNPQKRNIRELLSALNKVFRQEQFQS